jgi:antitoxin YefM
MKSTYSITEAQAKLPALVKEAADWPITITRRGETVGYLLSPEKLEAILETMEILANPEAMAAIREFEAGEGEYLPLECLDDEDD